MARQFIYNSIPHQTKTHANQLTMRTWNDYINILRIQTNDSSTYIETLNKWLFADASVEDKFYDGGFVSYIISSLQSLIDSKVDESAFNNTIQDINTVLSTKADTTYIEGLLALKADASTVTALQQTKADKTYVDAELSKKASTSVVDSVTTRVSNLESKDPQQDERLLNLENTKLNSSDFNSYKSTADNAITLKLEKNLSNIGTLAGEVGDYYTVVINDGVNSYKVTISELKEIFGSLDTEQQLNHYKGVYKKLIDVPAGSEGDYCFIERTENNDSILTMYVWNKTDNIWEETNTSQYTTSTVFSNFKQSIETGSTSVGLARDYTPTDGIGTKFTELETNKQDKLTFDETPTEGSTRPVTSGGLHKILKDGVGGIIDVDKLPQSGWSGTAVPVDGSTVVENIYLNNKLSIEETIAEMDKITNWIDANGDGSACLYFLLSNQDNTIFLGLVKMSGVYGIIDEATQVVYFISDGSVMGLDFSGWNPNVTYSVAFNSVSLTEVDGKNIGQENDKISSLFSTTPFVYEQGNINDKAIYRLKEEQENLPVIVDGSTVIENIYLNNKLSIEETIAEINKITDWVDDYIYPIFTSAEGNGIMLEKMDGVYNIISVDFATIYFTSDGSAIEQSFNGWNPDISYPIAFNSASLTEMNGFAFGTQNDKISKLISINPFGESFKYTYWVYKDGWSEFGSGDNGVEVNLIDLGEITFNEEHSTEDFKVLYIPFEQSIINDSNFENTVVLFSYMIDIAGLKEQVFLKPSKIFYWGELITFYTFSGFGKSYAFLGDDYNTTLLGDRREYNFVYSEAQAKSGTLSCKIGSLGSDITFDSTPTLNSTNAVTSGGVYTALQGKLDKSLSDVTSNTNVATTDNMVINKDGTMYKVTIQELQEVFGSDNYKGNFTSTTSLPATGKAGDYAFVKKEVDGDTDLYMYIWNDVDRHWEETSLSQYVKNATFQATMETKQDKLTFDETPVENSNNPVTSGGVYEALQTVGGIIDVDKLPQLTGTLLVSNPETTVNKVIFNDQLSIEDTIEILSQLTYYDFNGNQASALYSNATATSAIIVTKNSDTDYRINHYTNVQTLTFTRIFTSVVVDEVVGWINTEYEINQTGVTSLMGLPIGIENEKLKELVSMNDGFTINVNDKSIYRLKEPDETHLEGTLLVSNQETTVNKVFFNNNLSNETMNKLLSTLTYTEFNGLNVNVLFTNATATKVIFAYNYADNQYGLYYSTNIASGSADVVFYDDIRGWVTNEIEINDVGVSSLYGLSIGTNNESLQQVLSMNDNFTVVDDSYKYTYWVYKDKWVQLLTDKDKVGGSAIVDVDVLPEEPKSDVIYRLNENEQTFLGYTGTAVPNSGTFGSLYINQKIGITELKNTLNKLSWIDASALGQSGFKVYPVLAYMNGSYPYVLAFKKYTEEIDSHLVGDINIALINFANMSIIQDFYISSVAGWQTFENPYPINSPLLSELSGILIGTQNDIISSVFSSTLFSPIEGNKYTYWIYKDKWVQLNNSNDLYIIEKPFPGKYMETGFDGITLEIEEIEKSAKAKESYLILYGDRMRVYFRKAFSQVSGNVTKVCFIGSLIGIDATLPGMVYSYPQNVVIIFTTQNTEGIVKEAFPKLVSFEYEESPTRIDLLLETGRGTSRVSLSYDLNPIASSKQLVSSGGVYRALETKQDTLEFDTTPTSGSTNPVTSGGIFEAIQSAIGDINAILDQINGEEV